MVAYEDQETIPIDREAVWSLLKEHLDPTKIVQIHPEIVSQRLVAGSGSEQTVERGIRFFGKVRMSTWKITYRPPDTAIWEIVQSAGPMCAGSRLVNTYREVPGGTVIESRGEITVARFPGFLQRWVVRSAMEGIGKQDRAYLARNRR